MLDKFDAIEARFREVELLLSNSETMQDMKRFTQLNKEYSDLKEVVETANEYKTVLNYYQQAKDILANEKDQDLKEMARMEAEEMEAKIGPLEDKIRLLLIPKDPEDAKNAIVEIRAGTGGDEASLFAGDLMKMYMRYCENKGWKVEVLDESEGTAGGYKEVILEVTGNNVYGDMKYESGVHRVQRVPKTESALPIPPVITDEKLLPTDPKVSDSDVCGFAACLANRRSLISFFLLLALLVLLSIVVVSISAVIFFVLISFVFVVFVIG